MIFGGLEDKTHWTLGPWTSDAQFLYFSVEGPQVRHLIFCGGRFARVYDKFIFQHPQQVERFEWVNKNGVRESFSSDERINSAFSEDALELYDPVL
jgi:hypothetical protein